MSAEAYYSETDSSSASIYETDEFFEGKKPRVYLKMASFSEFKHLQFCQDRLVGILSDSFLVVLEISKLKQKNEDSFELGSELNIFDSMRKKVFSNKVEYSGKFFHFKDD